MIRSLVPFVLVLTCGIPCFAQDTPPPPPAEGQKGEATPEEGAPEEGAPEEGAPEEGAPEEGAPEEGAPEEGEGEAEGEDEEGAEDEGGVVESPIATQLTELLNVPARYKDGRVELVYTFRNPEEINDWENKGFNRAEQANAKGRRKAKKKKKNQTLALATSRAGILTHKVPFLPEVEVEITCHVERGATRSDLVLGVGKAGVRHGQAFVRKSGSGFKSVGRPFAAESPFKGGAKATLKLKASGAVFSAQFGKDKPAVTDSFRDKMAGRVFLYTTQAHLVIHRVVIRGEVDLEALDDMR